MYINFQQNKVKTQIMTVLLGIKLPRKEIIDTDGLAWTMTLVGSGNVLNENGAALSKVRGLGVSPATQRNGCPRRSLDWYGNTRPSIGFFLERQMDGRTDGQTDGHRE